MKLKYRNWKFVWIFFLVLTWGASAYSLSCIQLFSDQVSTPSSLSSSDISHALSEFHRAVLGFDSAYRMSNLPVIQDSELNYVKTVGPLQGYNGDYFQDLILSEYKGRIVFTKYAKFPKNFPGRDGLGEPSLAKLMGDLGLGPAFHGVVKNRNGKIIGFVTDFVNGYEIKHSDMVGRQLRISAAVADFLNGLGLSVIGDLQYRVEPQFGRMWVVDTGRFKLFDVENPFDTIANLKYLNDLRELLRR